jgi:hypothetical protein
MTHATLFTPAGFCRCLFFAVILERSEGPPYSCSRIRPGPPQYQNLD